MRVRRLHANYLRRLLGVGLAATMTVAMALSFLPSAAFANNQPAISFSGPSATVTQNSVTFSYTINRGGKQIAANGLTCSLSGPVSSNTCGNVNTVQRSTDASVTLTGLSPGTYTYNVNLLLTDGGGATASTTFVVVVPAKLSVAPTTSTFGTVVVGRAPKNETFTVKNIGGSTSGKPNLTLSGTDPSQWKIATNGCTSGLTAASTCQVTVQFAPTVAGLFGNTPTYTPITDQAMLDATASPGGSADASLTGTTTWGCSMISGISNLEGIVSGSYCDLTDLNLGGIYLSGINLSGTNLSGTNLSYANLSGTNLSYANLSDTTLTGANLADANLTGVTWDSTVCPDGTNSNNDGGTCANNL